MFKRFVLAHRRFLDAIAAWLDYQQKEDYYESVRSDNDSKMGLSIVLMFALAVTMGSCAGGRCFRLSGRSLC